MSTTKCTETILARIQRAQIYRNLGNLLDGPSNVIYTRYIKSYFQALRTYIQSEYNGIYVPSTFSIPKKASFDTISTSQGSQLRRRNSTSSIIMYIYAQPDLISSREILVYIFYLIGKHVGSNCLYTRRKSQYQISVRRRLLRIRNRFYISENSVDSGIREIFKGKIICLLRPLGLYAILSN